MLKAPTQHHRNMAIATSLGDDALLLDSFSYTEDLSHPYQLTAIVSSAKPKDVAIEDTIGNAATIRVQRKDKKTRYLGGIVVRITHDGRIKERPRYELTIVPKFWLLSRNSDCRIFQKKSVPEIIKQVFGDRGIADSLSDKLKGTYEKRDYTVQYRESDFNFLSRLMEMEGIYYFHAHDKNGRHHMVLADDPACHEALEGYAEVPFQLPGAAIAPDRVTDWRVDAEIQTEKVTLKAFDFKAPNVKPKETKTLDYPSKWASEIYDYPMEFHLPAEVKRHAKLRAEEIASGAMHYTGRTDCRGITCGGKFQLTDPLGQLRKNLAKEYLIVGVRLHGAAGDYHTGGNGATGASGSHEEEFSCSFTCTQAKKVFRPSRATQKPVVAGAQTATVVGPKGSEIHTDKYGRVKIQFHWDRYGSFDENSSCWIRVSQPWAGQGWGGVQIPRVGQEVIVDFLEGDPDRPIITGRVYNAASMPPVSGAGRDAAKGETNPKDMMEAAMQMTLRSNSLGGSGGHNEITMHDAGGAEKMFIRAQKDEVHLVQNDRKDTVGHDETRDVGNDRTRSVGNNERVSVGNNRSKQVGSNESVTIGASKTETISIANTQTIGAANTVTVGGANTLTVGAAHTVTVGGVMTTSVALMQFENVGLTKSVNVGEQHEMVCGSASIVLKSDGTIVIKGKAVLIDGSDSITVVSKGNVDIDGGVIDLN